MNTQSGRILFAAGLITAALASGAIGQQDEKLGKVVFPTSCDPNVQAEFDRGVAMLHSYWFLKARRTFEGILQQDPTCAMAHWGVAMDYLGNTLATTPTRADSQAAWDALEKARVAGAKTQRERDWIEALSAYFRDHDKVAVNARLAAYNAAMERMAQSYPDDYEVQVYYALTLQASAQKSDLTYANQIKSVVHVLHIPFQRFKTCLNSRVGTGNGGHIPAGLHRSSRYRDVYAPSHDAPAVDREPTNPLTRKPEDVGTAEEYTGLTNSPGYGSYTQNLEDQTGDSDLRFGNALPGDEQQRDDDHDEGEPKVACIR